jgi:PAS domain S-box-containing protein
LSAFGWIPRTLASEYGLQIGSAAEMMLLSFALVYRINLLRDKKEKAEREALREAGRLHLEESLQRSLQERNTILDNAMVAIIFLNAKGTLQWANQATYKIFGVPPGQGMGESIEAFYPSHEDYVAVNRAVIEATSRGQSFEDERWMRRGDGELIWVYTSGRTVSPTDASQGTVWAVMDITKRRQLEENLRRTEEQYRLVVDNVSEGMVVVQDGRFIFANPALLRLMGYNAGDILGQEFLPLVYIDDREFFVANHARRTRGEAFESKYDFRALHKTGQLIWVHIATVVVQWDGQPALLSFISDITQRKQAEEDIRASLEKQRELNSMKSRFVSVTSHEFRTPLSTILSSAELLKYYSDKMPQEERTSMLVSIETAVARMKRMIDDILLIGKSEADKLEFDPQPLPLRAFLEALVDESRASMDPEAAAKLGIDFRMTGDANDAKFDEKLLRQIFSNLLSNAIKYSPNGGRVFFGVACRADEVEFHVADQGIGMPEEDVARLFETFYRASNVGTISGTGLGLSIVRRAVKLHGGTIKVDSVLGTGTRFIVNLPRAG